MNLSSEYTEDIRSLPCRSAHKRGELFMQKLSGRKLLLIGFTLFSMFFGAGNLIFPPDLGAKAGIHFWPAFLGLAISAVGLPIAGVVAVARAQGLEKLAGRVHPVFAQVFMILIYLSIGPCLAIPRTASTSFAMLAPLVGTGAGLQLGYSAVFFAAAFLVALRPERLTRWLGRLLCPCLLVLILVLFGGCLLHPLAGQYGAPTPEYTSGAVLQGVLYGYQTMDTLAALNFGAVIALNIQAQGVTRQEEVQRSTILAGFVAGGLLLAVYAMLGHAGALTGAAVPGLATGADVLTVLADRLFGKAGLVLLAAIFVLACFNTCVGLIACVGEYFHTLVPSVPYPAFAGFFAAASMLLSNLGLADILRLSVPVLNALYPVAILLICLSFVPELEQRHPLVYPLCIGCTALQSVASALPLGPLSALAKALPLGAVGFGWVLPATVGLLAGMLLRPTPHEPYRRFFMIQPIVHDPLYDRRSQAHHCRGSRGRVSGAVQPGHPQKVRPLQHRGGLSFAGGCAPHQALEKHQGAVRNCRRQAAHPHLYRLDGPDHPARDRPLRRHPDLMPPCNLRAKGVKYSHEPNTGELVMQAERKESTFDPLT